MRHATFNVAVFAAGELSINDHVASRMQQIFTIEPRDVVAACGF